MVRAPTLKRQKQLVGVVEAMNQIGAMVLEGQRFNSSPFPVLAIYTCFPHEAQRSSGEEGGDRKQEKSFILPLWPQYDLLPPSCYGDFFF